MNLKYLEPLYLNINNIGNARIQRQSGLFGTVDDFRKLIPTLLTYNGGIWIIQGTNYVLDDSLDSSNSRLAASANAVRKTNEKFDARVNSFNVKIGTGSDASILDGAIAIGTDSKARSNNAIAMGARANSLGSGAVCIGNNAKVDNSRYGIAIGDGAVTSTEDTAVSIGSSAKSTGSSAVSIGNGATSNGLAGVALGYNALSPNARTGVLGSSGYTNVWQVPGSFSVTGTKNFEMSHPKPEKAYTHVLRHGAVESPTAGDTLYRYFISPRESIATVRMAGLDQKIDVPVVQKDNYYVISIPLPDYWVWLNTNEQVTVNPDMHFGTGYGYIDRVHETLELVIKELKPYHVIAYGTRNDNHESVQSWKLKGAVREIGESWTGETYVFEIEEYKEITEFKEEY